MSFKSVKQNRPTKKKLIQFAAAKNNINYKRYGVRSIKNLSSKKILLRRFERNFGYKRNIVIGAKLLANFMVFLLIFTTFSGTLFIIGTISAYSTDLPDFDAYLVESQKEEKESVIVDRKGRELYRLQGTTLKERAPLSEIPSKVQWAFIAAEDAQFWGHKGLNIIGLSRAFMCASQTNDITACQGGSSITQQLVKKTTGLEKRSVQRKAKEAVLAMRVEQKYTKQQILEYYLNIVPEGGILQGVRSGAKYLFGKTNLNDLTLAEIAYLAGIPNEPRLLSPWGGTLYDPEKSQERAIYVLNRLVEIRQLSGVSLEEIEKAKAEVPSVKFLTQGIKKKAPHFVDYVISELDKQFANQVPQGKHGSDFFRDKGYTIVTSLDLDRQGVLERSIEQGVKSSAFQRIIGAQNAAGVIMDPRNGEVLAMVGSRNFYESSNDPRFSPQHNAALTPRSMGSTMKPALYLAAFRAGYSPSTTVPDYKLDLRMPGSREAYYPQNYDRIYSEFGKYITIRTALKYSLNVPAVATFHLAGWENYVDTYNKLNGWSDFKKYVQGPAAPLGGANIPLLEQVHAYATMAAEGAYHPIKVVRQIQNDKGAVIYDYSSVKGVQVIDPKYIFLINDMNKNYSLFRSDSLLLSLANSMDIAGKTGTGDNAGGYAGDVAFMAYSPTFVMGVWAGNSCGATKCPLSGRDANGKNLYDTLYKNLLINYLPYIERARFSGAPRGVKYVGGVCSGSVDPVTNLCNGKVSSDWAALPPYDYARPNYKINW